MFINRKIFYSVWRKLCNLHLLADECLKYDKFIHMISITHYRNIVAGLYPRTTLLTSMRVKQKDEEKPLSFANLMLVPYSDSLPTPYEIMTTNERLRQEQRRRAEEAEAKETDADDDADADADDEARDGDSLVSFRSLNSGSDSGNPRDPLPFFHLPDSNLNYVRNIPPIVRQFDIKDIFDRPKFTALPQSRRETEVIEDSTSVAHHPVYLKLPQDTNTDAKQLHDASTVDPVRRERLLSTFYDSTDLTRLDRSFAVLGNKKAVADAVIAAEDRNREKRREAGLDIDRSDILERVMSMMSPDAAVRRYDLYNIPKCATLGCTGVVYADSICVRCRRGSQPQQPPSRRSMFSPENYIEPANTTTTTAGADLPCLLPRLEKES